MKQIGIIMMALVLLGFTSAFAADQNAIKAPKVKVEAEKYIVPVELTNAVPMTALDMPLQFTEGVTLEEVTFEGTRSADFDFTWANINNEENTVVIGLIPMIYGEKSDLAPGTGVIANLVFTVDDPDVEAIELNTIELENPNHSLMLVYNDDNNEAAYVVPEFNGVSVNLQSAAQDELLPMSFSLKQNAPNPFNPQTRIDYDLPQATNVNLDIFNVLGQKVKTVVNEFQEAGSKSVIWDGRDDGGVSVASGIYFYRLNAGDYNETRKMMMLK
nr:T9SS type A sorting domain-containing protein [candidate division Zixibacteria bacterium]